MAPAAAPMTNHLAARAMRRKGLPPRAILKGVVPLLGERGGLGFFIGEIGLRGG